MIRFRRKVSVCVLILVIFGFCSGDNEHSNVMKIRPSGTGGRSRSILKYNTMQEQKNSTEDMESFVPYDFQIVIDAVSKLNYSECSRDALKLFRALNRKERWAVQMVDASSKFPVGLLHGNFYQFGNFDECVMLRQPTTNTEDPPIQGQYCLADVELFNTRKVYNGRVARSFESTKIRSRYVFNNTLYWGICVPSSCTPEEVAVVIKELFTLVFSHNSVTVRLNDDKCHIDKPRPFTTSEILYGCVVGVFLVFIALVTAFHYYVIQVKNSTNYNMESREPKNNLKEAILCFSLIKTIGKFLATKTSSLNLECISGIKFISMFFIIVGHCFVFLMGGPVQNTKFFVEESQNILNGIFLNSPLLVDTFLLMSGFLMCYLFLLELDKRKGKTCILALYIGRYIRLTPSYLVVIGFYCTFLFRLGSGPLWDSRIKLEQERCIKSWWTNILYINNYVNTDHLCMFQSWYLAADYHLFIIAPFIIYPLWKWHKIGKALLGLGIFTSIIVPFIVTLKDKLDPTLILFGPEVYDLTTNHYFKTAYIKTHMRAGSYFLGLFVGYALYKLQTKKVKIHKYVVWFGWLLCAVCGILSLYSVVIFYRPDHEHNSFEAAVYAALHRVAWCISIGWIIIMCVTNNATLVNKFLSWKPFIPLSRLTYCAYLINGLIEVYSFGTIREGNYMSKFELGSKAVAHSLMTFAFAFFLCILFESPIHGLENIALRRASNTNTRKAESDQVNNNAPEQL